MHNILSTPGCFTGTSDQADFQ